MNSFGVPLANTEKKSSSMKWRKGKEKEIKIFPTLEYEESFFFMCPVQKKIFF